MTYEEISTKYPIGKLLAREIIHKTEKTYVANEMDKSYFLAKFKNVSFTSDGMYEYACYTVTEIKKYYVQGWIATNEGFFVAENTWDGWVELDDDDLAEIEKKGIACEF